MRMMLFVLMRAPSLIMVLDVPQPRRAAAADSIIHPWRGPHKFVCAPDSAPAAPGDHGTGRPAWIAPFFVH